MTHMIPEIIPPSTASNAEKRMFEFIRDAPGTERWVCIHSLYVADHPTKRRGEVDFVLLTHHGVFFLEVKGGRIKRQRGAWYSVDAQDKRHQLHESPFDQAAGGMFALGPSIKKYFKGKVQAEALFGYGVLFPDDPFDHDSPEWDRRVVYDIRDTEKRFTSYVGRLAEAARAADPREKRPTLKPDDIRELADYLRGDLISTPPADRILDVVRKQLHRLTAEQLKTRRVLETEKRAIIEGGAGTGKTILAVEIARRMAVAGDRVLFLCFNKMLAERLRTRLSGERYSGELVVSTLHDHFYKVVQGTDGRAAIDKAHDKAKKDKRAKSKVFRELYPLHAGVVALDRPDDRFDALVIDEAQDILTNANLDTLDVMLRGGLENGRWYVFLDGRDQAAVYDNMEPEALDRLAAGNVRERLSINCRNTVPIAEQTAIVSVLRERVSARVDGMEVDIKIYRQSSERLGQLERVVSTLRQEGVSPGRISVLFVNRPRNDEPRRLQKMGLKELSNEEIPGLGTVALDIITWSTVSGFKGLENDVVVLVGVQDIEARWDRGVAYVGMSRARTRLYLIIQEDCEKKRREREKELRERHDSDFEELL